MLIVLTGLLLLAHFSCFTFGADGGEKLTSVICELANRLADLEERLFIQELVNKDLEIRLKVQEGKNRDQEDLIKALSARHCISTSQQAAPATRRDDILHHRSVNRSSNTDRINTQNGFPVAKTFEKAGKAKKEMTEDKLVSHRLHNANGGRSNRDSDGVAFYSYMSETDMHPKQNQTIVFDHVVTNTGGKFDFKTGTFCCPLQGVYAFSWTVYCSNGGYLISELVVNSLSVGAMLCSGQGDDNIRHTSSVAVVELMKGDRVYVRTHPKAVLNGVLWSAPTYRSFFSGWKLF